MMSQLSQSTTSSTGLGAPLNLLSVRSTDHNQSLALYPNNNNPTPLPTPTARGSQSQHLKQQQGNQIQQGLSDQREGEMQNVNIPGSAMSIAESSRQGQTPSTSVAPQEKHPSSNAPPMDAASAPHWPNPNIEHNPHVFMSVYSSVPVYEMMVRGIGVMRRRADSFMNATQILKVAGVDKGKRTKILEKDIVKGEHEKIQGGYGRYQGTWIPFYRAKDLADQYAVTPLLAPLFDYTAAPPRPAGETAPSSASTPNDGQSASAVLSRAREQGLLEGPIGLDSSKKRSRDDSSIFSGSGPEGKRARLDGVFGRTNGDVEDTEMKENGDVEEVHDPKKIRRASRPSRPTHSIGDDPRRSEKHRNILMNIFVDSPAATAGGNNASADPTSEFPPDLDPDTPIDDRLHAALHWAGALARISLVTSLINLGADIHRGNDTGETPLIRAIQVTNNQEQDSFPALLNHLALSLRTIDDSNRTVLHHIALVAGVKGRAPSARYYMECVLEWVAKNEGGEFGDLIDHQDINGDTALNIAARVGNKALVRALIEVGADKVKPNKLGLRPGDFGVEGEDLKVSNAEELLNSIRTAPAISAPIQKSQDVIESLTSLINSLSSGFANEIKGKSESLERIRAQLRAATRELAEQRRQIQSWRQRCSEVEETGQRIKNLERALEEEDSFDWTGRTEIDGTPAKEEVVGSIFKWRGPDSTLTYKLSKDVERMDFDPDPSMNLGGEFEDFSAQNIIHLQRMKMWYTRVLKLLRDRIASVEGASAEREIRCKKIVSACCGIPVEKVESMLDQLVIAVESDGRDMDMVRLAGFMGRVKEATTA